MYMDKLDGRIDAEFFDRKAAEFRAGQCRLMRDIDAHQVANKTYIEEGIKLLELAHPAHRLFESQHPNEKRKLLDFVLSNCRWKGGRLDADYRQPFDLIATAAFADRQLNSGGSPEKGDFDNWRRKRDSNPRRVAPSAVFKTAALNRSAIPPLSIHYTGAFISQEWHLHPRRQIDDTLK